MQRRQAKGRNASSASLLMGKCCVNFNGRRRGPLNPLSTKPGEPLTSLNPLMSNRLAPRRASQKPVYKRIVLKLSGEVLKGQDEVIDARVADKIAAEVAEVHAMGRAGRRRHRRRQHLARHHVGQSRHGPQHRRLHGHAGHDHQRHGAAGGAGKSRRSTPACRRRSRSRTWPSLSSAAAPCAIWKKGAWSSSSPARATPSSPPIPPRPCAPASSARRSCSRPPRSTASTKATRAKNPNAKRFEHVTYGEALERRLQVMDSTAFALCMDNEVPIVVFDMFQPGNIRSVVLGERIGTLVSSAA